jgi:hypothetical protein
MDEVICGVYFWRVGFDILAQHVAANMALDNFSHEAIECPAARCKKLQDGRTLLLFFKGSVQSVHLTANAIHAFEELVFVSSSVGHRPLLYGTPLYY